jgi:AcrR family transcriptional regulator
MAARTVTNGTAVQPSAHELRKREIAAAAASLFAATGVAKVSMDDIAAKVGIAKASLYHYFKNKDEILYSIETEMSQLNIGRARKRKQDGLSPLDRLRGAFCDAFDLVDSHPGYARVVFEHLRQLASPYKRKVQANQRAYENEIRDIFEAGVADGSFAVSDIHLTTLAFFGLVNWSHQWYSPSGPYKPEQLGEQFCAYFVFGIAGNVLREASGESGAELGTEQLPVSTRELSA